MKSLLFDTWIVRKHIFSCLLLLFLSSISAFGQNIEIRPDKTSGCPPFTVLFDTRLDAGYTRLEWDFGIGANVIDNPAPSRIFPDPGVYHVKLTANYPTGQVTKTVDITVFNKPVVSFAASNTSGCVPFTASFTDNSTPGDGTIESIIWNFGDGVADQGATVSHEYAQAGSYNVISLVTNTRGCKTSSNPFLVKVQEAPLLSFTADKTQSCTAPLTVNFQNTTVNNTGDPITYVWDYGDGTSGTDLTHTYAQEGVYTVTLLPNSQNGCAKPLQKRDYIVIKKLVPAFTVAGGCSGGTVTLTSTTAPVPDDVTWFLPDGSTTHGSTATFTGGAPGDYTVRMRATLAGCMEETVQTVHIAAPPTIDPVATPVRGCITPFTTTFSAQSANAMQWLWDFGDGTTSTLENPSHTYTREGSYTITLTATSANSCSETVRKSNYINIQPPVLSIIPPANTGCVPLTISYSAVISTGEPITSYEWDFGDGTTSTASEPLHTFTTQGIFTVKLHVVTAAGCTADATALVRTGTLPVVDFDATPLRSCPQQPVQFINHSTPNGPGVTWQWTFPQDNASSNEENPSHSFTEIGKHDVLLIVNNNGCIQQLFKREFILILPPRSRFNTTPDCANPYHRKFNDQSDFGAEPVPKKEWLWEFGEGGATSTLQHPDFTYTTTGSKVVKLTIDNGICKSESTININIIDEKPVLLPDVPWICAGKSLHVSLGPMNAGNINGYTWDWGDGTVERFQGFQFNPATGLSHIYRNTGTYTIQLTIEDKNGCIRSAVPVTMDVHGATPDFSVAGKKCKNEIFTFNDRSTVDPNNQIMSWSWNFGDGSPADDHTTQPLNITHKYTNPGDYTVVLTTIDKYGCMVPAQQTISIETVKADFTMPSNIACKDNVFNFTSQSAGTITDYAWNFGDNTIGSGSSPNKTYTTPGTYDVTLKITTAEGCTDEVIKQHVLRVPEPVADFSFPPNLALCPPVKVLFTNKSADFVRSEWDFGDNSTSTKNDPGEHIYVRAKTYNVMLTVYSEGGCKSSKSLPVTIEGPDGSFTVTPKQGCAPLAVSITAISDKTTDYEWDFDDGTVIPGKSPVAPPHTYTRPGIYSPRVSLIDAQGCAVKAQGEDKVVVDNAVADFTVDNTAACGGGVITFKNNSSSVTKSLLGLDYASSWTYGMPGNPGNTSANTDGSFDYPQPGTFTVTLQVTSAYGCTDSKTLPVIVPPQPQPVITPIPELCVSGKVQLQGTETNNLPATKWQWQIGTAQQYNVPVPPELDINTIGTTPVTLTITNADGSCPGKATASIIVHPAPVLNPTPLAANVCRGATLQLQANTDPRVTVSWTPYNISDAGSLFPVVKPDIDTVYKVLATNEFGCTNNKEVRVTVTQPFRIYAQDAEVCAGKSVQLLAGGALRYKWIPATALNRADIPEPVATPDGNITYQVVGFDDNACFTDTALARVYVHPSPQINAGPDIVVPSGSVVPIPTVGSADIIKIAWTPQTGLSCFDCLTPTATPKGDATYQVSVMNQYGCTSIDNITIKTVCNEGNVFVPNSFSPNGDGMNDIFYIRGRGMQSVRVFRVFNRWGQLVFERSGFSSDDPAFGWDGRFKGTLLNPDVFVYYTEIVCDKGEPFVLKGNITLIR